MVVVTQVVVAAPAADSATAEVVVAEATVVKVMAEVVAGVAARYHQEGPWQAPSSFATCVEKAVMEVEVDVE